MFTTGREANNLKRKISKTTLALVFFALALILSIAGMFVMVSIYHPTYAIYATKYNDKPTTYFAIDSPDRYVLEAISNGHSSIFNSLDCTQIDELTKEYLSWNVEYHSNYYSISILYGDNFPPFMLPQVLLAGIVVSITAIVIISFYKAAKYLKSKVHN